MKLRKELARKERQRDGRRILKTNAVQYLKEKSDEEFEIREKESELKERKLQWKESCNSEKESNIPSSNWRGKSMRRE